jgi:cation diffusion facilitator family transporter
LSADASVESPQENPADRAFRIGLFGNLGLAGLKLAVGWVAGSPALVADGWHSSSDVVMNGGTWLAHRFGRREPDEDHHYGHAKAEAFAGLIVGLFLVGVGFAVMWETRTTEQRSARGWSGNCALAIAVLSIVVNVGLAWISLRAGRTARSAGLFALARDDLSDALASFLVVLAILGSWSALNWAEPAAVIVIGCLIVVMGARSVVEGFDILMDRVSDKALRGKLERTARGVDEVRGVQSVRVHPVGNGYRVDMEISVDGALSVGQGHQVAHSVERAVTAEHSAVIEVHVHVNPWTPPAAGAD